MLQPEKSEIVVITGASAGIGRATARAFAQRGARIGLIARGIERLESTRREVEHLGGEAMVLQADVADPDQVHQAAEAVENHYGPIGIWINNAMTTMFAELHQMKPEEYRRVTDVVYHGTVFGTMAALERMLPRDAGVIVCVGSVNAYRGLPLQSAYCAAKQAVQALCDSLRTELQHAGSAVRVSLVQLPAVNTPQFNWARSKMPRKAKPISPIFQPEVAADAIVWAAYHDRPQFTLGNGGQIHDGGYEDQMRDEAEDPERADNLWEPVPGEYSAHGDFDHKAKDFSTELWAKEHKGLLSIAGGTLAAGAIAGIASFVRKKLH